MSIFFKHPKPQIKLPGMLDDPDVVCSDELAAPVLIKNYIYK